MITLKEWMELCEYRITEGDCYGWQCFGDHAQSLSSWNGNHEGWSMNVVFDTQTQTVYTVEVCDYKHQRAYRMINPDFQQAHDDEARAHDVDAREAWDTVNYVDLEDDDDFMQKGLAIRAGEDYDTRVSIPVNLPDDVTLILMRQAHEKDITFNQHMENILKAAIDHTFAQHGIETPMRDDYDFSQAVPMDDVLPKTKKSKKKGRL